jgi:hypothetical protein
MSILQLTHNCTSTTFYPFVFAGRLASAAARFFLFFFISVYPCCSAGQDAPSQSRVANSPAISARLPHVSRTLGA